MGCLILGVIALVALIAAIVTALAGTLVSWVLGATGFRPGTAQVVLVTTALLLVLFATVAQRGIRRFSQPMDDLIDAAGRIEKGDYSAQLSETGPAELTSVARAFNSMSSRLKTSDEQRRSFLADVAHELRTPLSIIRGQAEAIADGVYPGDPEHVTPILDATRTLEVLVEDLRTLVLTDAGSLVLNREHVEPGALVQDVLASFETQSEAFGVSMASAIAAAVPNVDVDPARLRSALANVVSNAIRHTPAGGSIRIDVTRARESRPKSSRAFFNASSKVRDRPGQASASRSRTTSSPRTGARSRFKARSGRAPRSASPFRRFHDNQVEIGL